MDDADKEMLALPTRADMQEMVAAMNRLAKASETANAKMDALTTTTQAAPAAMQTSLLNVWHTVASDFGLFLTAVGAAWLIHVVVNAWRRKT